jgi:4-amino-4-deoxy-L-arabinose transferase-like glycosyltransferase
MGLQGGMIARLTNWVGQGRNGLLLGLGLFLALVAMSWVGFIGSDDATYAKGAYGWIDAFPGLYVGGHGTIRYLITIPMALSFSIFGENSFGMVLPCLLYSLAFMILAWRAVRDAASTLSANLALLVLATSPLLVIQSRRVSCSPPCFSFGAALIKGLMRNGCCCRVRWRGALF